MNTRLIQYQYNGKDYEAFLAADGEQKPTVLVIHDWSGRNEFACEKAKQLALWGYCGIAIDLYGKGKIGTNNAEKSTLMQPLVQDRQALRQQLLAQLTMAIAQPESDATNVGVMGFCFGGLCALDFARSGADLKGAISVHGFLTTPPENNPKPISAKILALHGYDDPMVSMADTAAFCTEMTEKKVDWQLQIFGQTSHAFTNPLAHDTSLGLIYNPVSEQRAMNAIEQFWHAVFS